MIDFQIWYYDPEKGISIERMKAKNVEYVLDHMPVNVNNLMHIFDENWKEMISQRMLKMYVETKMCA